MTRVVKDQAMAIGEGRKAELDNGITIWATGTGNFANDKTNEGPDACRSLHLISIP